MEKVLLLVSIEPLQIDELLSFKAPYGSTNDAAAIHVFWHPHPIDRSQTLLLLPVV